MNRILFVFRNGISKYFHVFYLKKLADVGKK